MPSFLTKTFSSFWKRILQFGHSGNTGTPTSLSNIQSGDGVNTALSLSDDVLQVQPQNDDGNTLLVKNQAGNNILAVDTTNSKLLGGASQTALNTSYAHFGTDFASSVGFIADTHMAIPFGLSESSASYLSLGSSTSSSFNDTNPASSLAVSNNAHYVINMYWYVIDNITVDAVHWLNAADDATGDDVAAHLMSYAIDTDNGSTGGDLSSGTVVADGATITNAGYEQIYYQSMTIQSADVDAGRVILFTFASDTINADYSINATVKYHIR